MRKTVLKNKKYGEALTLAILLFSLFFSSSVNASSLVSADINNDNIVDSQDLNILKNNWKVNGANASDLNNDSTVNVNDLSVLLSKWGSIMASPKNIDPGAKLPISHDINTLTGTKRYVAANGSDDVAIGKGTISAPYATIKKAESLSADGDTIIVRGGTYPMGPNALSIDRSNLKIIAYPGETPIFDGSISAPATATTEGSLKYFSYQPMPAGTGEGLSLANLPKATFTGATPTGMAAERGYYCVSGASYSLPVPTTENPIGCGTSTSIVNGKTVVSQNSGYVISGYYPDQVWVNGTPLIQVLEKRFVSAGKFWFQRSSATDSNPGVANLYLSSTDAADMSKVRVSSSKGNFIVVSAPNVQLSGFKIINNSPTWSQPTVLLNSNDSVVENVYMDSNAAGSLKISRGNTLSNLASGNTLRNITVMRSGWTGSVFYYNNDTTVDGALYKDNENHKEFFSSPQRGAIKITKSDRTRILNSAFENNTLGVWFDQSNYIADIVGNRFTGNTDSAVFYEISHGLTLANNYINGKSSLTGANIRLAGASGLKIVNNTIIGGKDILWMGQDARSKKFTTASGQTRDCSEHTFRYGQGGDPEADCWVGYTSDFDIARPGAYSPTGATNMTPGMDWNNSFDIFLNNVLADSDAKANCGSLTLLCVNGYIDWNSSMGHIYHHADLKKIFPSTLAFNGNVYQIALGNVAVVRADAAVSQQGAFTAANLTTLKGTTGFGSTFYNLNVESNGLFASSGLVDGQGNLSAGINHSSAASTPTDNDINKYIVAGSRHYGSY